MHKEAQWQKKSKFNSLMVDWHSCFHLPWGHSTQLQMWHHVCVDSNCPKIVLEHLHYFHTWSCLLPSKIQNKFLKNSQEPKMQKTLKQHQQFYLECLVLIIVDDINDKVTSITCIGFIQWCDGWFRVLLFTTYTPCMLTASNKSSNNTVMRENVLDIVLLNDVSLEFATSFLTAS